MTYFELYELPLTLHTDPKVLRKKYYELSKRFHPDFYANESEEKQAEILDLSTQNNKAYQTLTNPDKLVPYVLELHGVEAEGKGATLPQDFLMEMMDLNEQIMDLQIDPDDKARNAVLAEVATFEQSLQQKFEQIAAQFPSATDSERSGLLQQLKDYHLKKRYLLRIRESLGKIAAPNS